MQPQRDILANLVPPTPIAADSTIYQQVFAVGVTQPPTNVSQMWCTRFKGACHTTFFMIVGKCTPLFFTIANTSQGQEHTLMQ